MHTCLCDYDHMTLEKFDIDGDDDDDDDYYYYYY